MRTTKIKAVPYKYGHCSTTRDEDKPLYQFHFVEAGNNIILFPCYEGEVLRYDSIHEFLIDWRLIEKL